MDYFTAAQALINATQAASRQLADAVRRAPIPYWENLFPDAAGGALTATQAIARRLHGSTARTTSRRCGSSISSASRPAASSGRTPTSPPVRLAGGGELDRQVELPRPRVTLRKALLSQGFQFDFNYTLSQSKDHGSQVERGSAFGNFARRLQRFLVNSFDQELN
jgi:hypothetical protein